MPLLRINKSSKVLRAYAVINVILLLRHKNANKSEYVLWWHDAQLRIAKAFQVRYNE